MEGIPEQILEKFRIRDNDLENSIQKALEYLIKVEDYEYDIVEDNGDCFDLETFKEKCA